MKCSAWRLLASSFVEIPSVTLHLEISRACLAVLPAYLPAHVRTLSLPPFQRHIVARARIVHRDAIAALSIMRRSSKRFVAPATCTGAEANDHVARGACCRFLSNFAGFHSRPAEKVDVDIEIIPSFF